MSTQWCGWLLLSRHPLQHTSKVIWAPGRPQGCEAGNCPASCSAAASHCDARHQPCQVLHPLLFPIIARLTGRSPPKKKFSIPCSLPCHYIDRTLLIPSPPPLPQAPGNTLACVTALTVTPSLPGSLSQWCVWTLPLTVITCLCDVGTPNTRSSNPPLADYAATHAGSIHALFVNHYIGGGTALG